MTNPVIPALDWSRGVLSFPVRRVRLAWVSVQTFCAAVAVVGSLLAPAIVHAQVPWTVTLHPTVNPLAIGGCGPVWLTLLDSTGKDAPRNPTGRRVSLADFDMSVTSADPMGVAGEYSGPSIWSACACQAATIGSTATITATYPAKMLAQKQQVPGVAFQATATFTIAKARGAYEPVSCQALKNQTTVAAHASTASGSATTVTPITVMTPMATATPAGAAAPVTPTGSVMAGPTRAAPVGGLTPAPGAIMNPALQKRLALATPGMGPPLAVSVAGIATGVRVSFTLNPGSGFADVVLYRNDGAQQSTKRADLKTLACTIQDDCTVGYFDDVLTDPTLTYQYTVINLYADGTRSAAPPVTWASPPLMNPSGFTATDMGSGTVAFQWQAIPAALSYRIDGTGLPNTGLTVDSATTTVKPVPAGRGSWKLTAIYPANFADYKNPSVVSQLVRAVPPHTVAWLSKKNGPGRDDIAAMHYADPCPRTYQGTTTMYACPVDLAKILSNVPTAVFPSGAPQFQAIYANPGDLGFGRRTSCAQGLAPAPGFMTTVCWATSHGPGPTDPGYADPQVITQAAMQNTSIRTTTMIIKDATGMRFLVFGPPNGGGGYDPTPSAPSHYILLDSHGQKFAPHTCLACHGGTYDSTNHRVVGASFLPLNPWMLAYSGGPAGRPAQEESIRKINQYVLGAGPSPAITSYINGLYGGNVAVPGTRAVDDYVPSGWKAQAGLYRSVVRPYCATCHLAQQQSYSFSSWGNFQGNAALINAAVCAIHSMPHSELQFKEFWTKNTGSTYLPGLLAASLGYNSC